MDVDINGFVRDGFAVTRRAFDQETAVAAQTAVWDALVGFGGGPARPDNLDEAQHPPRYAARGALSTGRRVASTPGRVRPTHRRRTMDAPRGGRRRDAHSVSVRGVPRGRRLAYRGKPLERHGVLDGRDLSWRGLLTLFVFTDVGPADAPTRLVLGSHRYAAAALAEHGNAGLPGGDVPDQLQPSVLCRMTVEATGSAGDVYLCHPFVVHTATWPHRGTGPRMMAQPGVEVPDGFAIDGSDPSPVARAIVEGLADPSGLRPTRRR